MTRWKITEWNAQQVKRLISNKGSGAVDIQAQESPTSKATLRPALLYKKSGMAPCSWTQSLLNFLRKGQAATPGLLHPHHTNQGVRWREVVGALVRKEAFRLESLLANLIKCYLARECYWRGSKLQNFRA